MPEDLSVYVVLCILMAYLLKKLLFSLGKTTYVCRRSPHRKHGDDIGVARR